MAYSGHVWSNIEHKIISRPKVLFDFQCDHLFYGYTSSPPVSLSRDTVSDPKGNHTDSDGDVSINQISGKVPLQKLNGNKMKCIPVELRNEVKKWNHWKDRNTQNYPKIVRHVTQNIEIELYVSAPGTDSFESYRLKFSHWTIYRPIILNIDFINNYKYNIIFIQSIIRLYLSYRHESNFRIEWQKTLVRVSK